MTSTIKVNNIQNQCGQNIINENANTITLGASGDTIALASGASQTGFGRTGTVDWVTTPKTTTFTAVSGEGYFADTSSTNFTMNLPAGSAGDIVSVMDYAGTWQDNNLTVTPNGSDKIGGLSDSVTLSIQGQSVTWIYVDTTQGWLNTMDSTSNVRAENFISATVSGSCNTLVTAPDCANTKIATFTGPGNFTVSSISNCAPNNIVSYMVVAGGGGGGFEDAGGGGAGGFREVKSPATPYTASPLDGFSTPANRITVTATTFPIVVGAGGTGGVAPAADPTGRGANGSVSTFSTISSAGGGGGGGAECNSNAGWRLGQAGGAGGGGAGVYSPQPQDGSCGPAGGAGNTPPVSPSQGNTGGNGPTLNRQNNNVAELGGGGGGSGGNGAAASTGGAGGSGIVIIRYKFQ